MRSLRRCGLKLLRHRRVVYVEIGSLRGARKRHNVNLTPELERIARLKFDRLHPVHRNSGTQEDHWVKMHPALNTDHIMVQCGCGYRWRYAGRDLYAEDKTPVDRRPFSSLTTDFKRRQ